MLCATWELYLESLSVEIAEHFCSRCGAPTELPKQAHKELANTVRSSKHELKPLELAGDGWRSVLVARARQLCGALDTPKAGEIDDLFCRVTGARNVSDGWSCGKSKLDAFVSVRGDIAAHRGRYASYVKIGELKDYRALVDAAAVETDNLLASYVATVSPDRRKPWNATS